MIYYLATIALVLLAVTVAGAIYFTLAVNADANRQDSVNSAPPIGDDPEAFLRALHGAAGEGPLGGNDVTLYQNGDEIFPAMIQAIEGARGTVHFASYVYWPGEMARRFAALFARTARRGIMVRVVLDSEGAESVSPALVREMADAGCQVEFYRRARWYDWMRYNHRTHRRLLIVDGCVGFTGGVGIADEWMGNADAPGHWRDTHARITGPAVASLQAAFADNWNQCTDDLLLNARDYPVLEPTGSMTACIVVSAPSNGSSEAQRTMAACIAGATRSLHITNAYFLPTPAFVRNLCRAARRGVDVKVLVPGPHIDMPIVRCGSRHVWSALLDAGVEIHEFQPTMIHCKTLTVDGTVSLVGSINFDPRSFALNAECALVVADRGLAAEMERVFAGDLARSRRITREDVTGRSPFERARDAMCYWMRSQL